MHGHIQAWQDWSRIYRAKVHASTEDHHNNCVVLCAPGGLQVAGQPYAELAAELDCGCVVCVLVVTILTLARLRSVSPNTSVMSTSTAPRKAASLSWPTRCKHETGTHHTHRAPATLSMQETGDSDTRFAGQPSNIGIWLLGP